MENNQKSIIGPIVIIIVILALGSGFYYYSKNQKVNKPEEQTPVNVITNNTSNVIRDNPPVSKLIKYTDTSGLFSLMYPERFNINKSENLVKFYDKNNALYIMIYTDPDIMTRSFKQLEYLGSLPNHSYSKVNIVLGGQKGYRTLYNENTSTSIQYFIPLTQKGSTVVFVASITAVDQDSQKEWIKDASSAVESIVFDINKLNTSVQQALDVNQDAQLRAMVHNLRADSELYYDSHLSYTDLCKANGTAFSKALNGVKEKVGSDAKCYDGKNYAVSVKLTTGEFYCVDSTGFAGKTSKPASSSVCPQ